MSKDLWHFPRTELAHQVLSVFENGLSSALVFFAPRRMGKTEFLRKDIMPLAKKTKWQPFYYSFLDVGEHVQEDYTHALVHFAESIGAITPKNTIFSRIRKVGAEAAGIKANVELDAKSMCLSDMKTIFSSLSEEGKIVLLLDEVQALIKNERNQQFVAGLRTALDMYKDSIKVIFTGSSREGLRKMFSQASAPFFHFGQNLPFPELSQDFTDHLSNVFFTITKRNLDKDMLWQTFQSMDRVPQLARSLVERLALNPNLTVTEAKEQILSDLVSDRAYVDVWDSTSKLEQLLLREIASESDGLFSEKNRIDFAKHLGIHHLTVSSIQSALRSLQRKGLIGRSPEYRRYFVDDPNFMSWLRHIV